MVHYPFDEQASSFSSADQTLNDVWNLCNYSIKATNMDIYQDWSALATLLRILDQAVCVEVLGTSCNSLIYWGKLQQILF